MKRTDNLPNPDAELERFTKSAAECVNDRDALFWLNSLSNGKELHNNPGWE